MSRLTLFIAAMVGFLLLCFGATRIISNEYAFFAGFVVLQFVVLATAWNILGGYCGYVNFGSGAFFAMGAYSALFMFKLLGASVPVQILAAAVVSGLLGLGVGYFTMRLRGIFFAIATVALAVILETVILHWDFVGGARGMTVTRPASAPLFSSYTRFLFFVMGTLVVIALCVARYIERSWIGRGLQAIRDNEEAAECMGVPTVRLKLLACTLSGALMGIAGAPQVLFMNHLEPTSAFSLNYAVSALAMPIIGGTTHWVGPVIGAVLLGSVQQLVTVTVSSELNVFILGVLLVVFVVAAPNGILGLLSKLRKRFGGAK